MDASWAAKYMTQKAITNMAVELTLVLTRSTLNSLNAIFCEAEKYFTLNVLTKSLRFLFQFFSQRLIPVARAEGAFSS